MSPFLKDKTVFITGASSGIGAAVARECVRQGAAVALAARRLDRLEALCTELEAEGGKVLALACDVTDHDSQIEAVAKTVETFGGIDLVLANAGFGVSGPLEVLSVDDYRRQFETNFFGLLETIYATLPALKDSKGRLGLVASVAGKFPGPTASAYAASKFAVVGLAESIASELAAVDVSVTCINPGFVTSEIRNVNNAGAYVGGKDPIPGWLVMPTEKAARQIVRALYRRKPEAIITGHGKVLDAVFRHFPRTTRFLIRQLSKGGHLQKIEETRRGDTNKK